MNVRSKHSKKNYSVKHLLSFEQNGCNKNNNMKRMPINRVLEIKMNSVSLYKYKSNCSGIGLMRVFLRVMLIYEFIVHEPQWNVYSMDIFEGKNKFEHFELQK